MPVDLILFTVDRRISGAIPLADDRVSDMLNSVPRIVMRGAVIENLVTEIESPTGGRSPAPEPLPLRLVIRHSTATKR